MLSFFYFRSPITIVLLVGIPLFINAQKMPMKFGKIEPEYYEMKSYALDTSAEALILGDYGESRITYDQYSGLVVEYTRHFRAKIFKKSAYDWASSSIYLYKSGSSKEEVVTLKGRVYNMEGGTIIESDLKNEMINEVVIDRRSSEQKFTLPNVKEGSIIEYLYIVKSDFWSFPEWEFQHTIPALWSELRVSYPEYFDFKKLMKGYLSANINESNRTPAHISFSDGGEFYKLDFMQQNYRWVLNNIPAFKEEPFMNAYVNYVSSIDFELASFKPPQGMVKNYTQSWEDINKDLLEYEDFGLAIKRNGFLKETAMKIKANYKDTVSIINAAYETVKNRMKWNGLSRMYITQTLNSAWEKANGSSADINLMLVALLNELGIPSDPVILSTRSNGMIHPAQTMLGQFNYVIALAEAGNNTFLMDATEKNCSFTMLVPRCVNGKGRRISNNKSGWVDLNSTHRYEFLNIIQASVEKDGSVKGKLQRMYSNYAALDKRIEIGSKTNNEEYIRDLEDDYAGLLISNYSPSDLDSLSKPFKEEMEIVISDASLAAGNLLSFSAIPFPEWTSNPFKPEERKFPVDFIYPRNYRNIIQYSIPEGYTIDEKPESVSMVLPDGKTKFQYRVAAKDNAIQVMTTLDIGKALYTSEEYKSLKEFYGDMVNKEMQKIVLKKVTN